MYPASPAATQILDKRRNGNEVETPVNNVARLQIATIREQALERFHLSAQSVVGITNKANEREKTEPSIPARVSLI
jgi:hypothetical protein